MTLKIKLICDSLCDIPKEIQDKEYLDVVPLTIIFNDKEYKDGVDISKEEYYEILKNGKEIPKRLRLHISSSVRYLINI